ncbi:MAG: hypothetical protein K2X69_17780 [Silvanigrellaceae bacterium]|nr:hypothetical protein [Silvanigrellaceae bacterium]
MIIKVNLYFKILLYPILLIFISYTELSKAEELLPDHDFQDYLEKDELKNKEISENKIKNKKKNRSESDKKYKKEVMNKKCNKYTTSNGENLIQILRNKSMTPIYGIDGSLNKTLQLNPNLPINNYTFKDGEILCLMDSPSKSEEKNQTIKESIKISHDQKTNLNESQNFQMVYVEGGIRYLRLIENDSDTNTSALLLSRAMISAEGGLIQKWHPKFQSYFGINYAVSQIMQSDTSIVIGDSIIRLTNFFVGGKYFFLPYVYGLIGFGYGDELLFRAVNSQTIQVEKMSTAKLKFLGGLTMYEYRSFGFYGELAFLLNTPYNNEIYYSQIGKGYEAALATTYQGTGWDFRARIYYTRYETTIPPVVFDYTEVGLLLRLAVDLEN